MMKNGTIFKLINTRVSEGKKMVALLIDPDKTDGDKLTRLIEKCKLFTPDLIFVGGSLISVDVSSVYEQLKRELTIPIVTFPGGLNQISYSADGLLFLSLISGRNPELLIGNHVAAAPSLKRSGVEVISTGYILVDGGVVTSVQYMSNTVPVPAEKEDIAIATAIAGEFLGMKLIYLEAGSGALRPISSSMIAGVKNAINVPLIVGGGITNGGKLAEAFQAGADIVVIGTAVERDPNLLEDMMIVLDRFR